MVTLSTGRSADVPEILTFWSSATTVASATDDVGGLDALLTFDGAALIVARDDAQLVGTVVTGWDGWRASMYRLAVAPSHRRQGIGRMLVAEGEARLRALGARRFHLIVQQAEAPARAFWTAVGYEPTDQLRFVKTID
jgi:ribosomal protein S18 acetylase RimI-like enzyme